MARKKIPITKLVGFNIRRLREDAGMTQNALAELVSMSRTSISNIEVGRQRLLVEKLGDFADKLKVPVTELFNPEGYEEI